MKKIKISRHTDLNEVHIKALTRFKKVRHDMFKHLYSQSIVPIQHNIDITKNTFKKASIDVAHMLHVFVSIFKGIDSKTPHSQSNVYTLYDILQTHMSGTYEYKNAKSNADKKTLRKFLYGYTPAGYFVNERREYDLATYSHFINVEIKKISNKHISNFSDLITELKNIDNVAFINHLIDEEGFNVLIPIKDPQYYQDYCDALGLSFYHMGIIIDESCRDLTKINICHVYPEDYCAKTAILFDSCKNYCYANI